MQRIEQLGEAGEGEVLVDHTDRFLEAARSHNADVRRLLSGCGCSGTDSPVGVGLGAMGLLLLLRRRRRATIC